MNAQELLTYVEELVFKTSMFGYDKDEVDIQLDKICDEVEAIVKEKDRQIEALKNGQPIVVDEEVVRMEQEAETATEDFNIDAEEITADGIDEQADEDALREQINMLTHKVKEMEKQLDQAAKQVEEAEERAVEAEKKAAAAEGRAAVAESRAATQAAAAPLTKDEAYEQYIRNADLLCKQLSDLQGKEDSIVENARKEADKIIEDAEVQANEVLAGIQSRKEELQQQYEDLVQQKGKMVTVLSELTAEAETLIEKAKQS